jgi:hypothetical protein
MPSLTKGVQQLNMNNQNHRTHKRKITSREESGEFSQSSILSAMDRFVQSVSEMDETVMIPSRLMDMSPNVDEKPKIGDSPAPRMMVDTDLYSFYSMLNSVKNQLLWGPIPSGNTGTTTTTSGPHHVRRHSLASQQSFASTDSEPESELNSDSDSGVEFDEQTTKIASAFRQHLTGLYQILHQLSDSADFLAHRYQDEVGGNS